MARHNVRERSLERTNVETAAQSDRVRLVIARIVWLELIYKPQPQLRERKRRGFPRASSRYVMGRRGATAFLSECQL